MGSLRGMYLACVKYISLLYMISQKLTDVLYPSNPTGSTALESNLHRMVIVPKPCY